MLERVRIVLIGPSGPANVGAVCRAMANMGLRDLVVVAPRCDLRAEQAVGYAAHGQPVLTAARVVADIPAALAGCTATFATSSKLGLYRRQAAITPDEAARVAIGAAHRGPVAFAFGPERHGLRTRELLHFDRIVAIPAAPEYPVLNLAAAATVICYELRRAWLASGGQKPLPMGLEHPPATDEHKRLLYERLFDALDRLGFFFGQNPDHLRYALRHLFGRVDLTVNEADILIGLAQQIRWHVDQHPPRRGPADGAGAAGAR